MSQSYKMPSLKFMGQKLMQLQLHKHCIIVDLQEKRYALLLVSQIGSTTFCELLRRLHTLLESAMRLLHLEEGHREREAQRAAVELI